MAITFAERHELPGADSQQTPFGPRVVRTSRMFNVPGYDPVDAVKNVLLPPFGSSHPKEPGLIALAPRAVSRLGAGDSSGWIVEIPYAVNRFGDGGPIDRPDVTELAYRADNLTFATERKTVPYFVGHSVLVPNFILGGTIDAGIHYTRQDFEVPRRKSIYRVRVNVTKSNFGLTQVTTIGAQVNKIHVFGGTEWLFQGADVEEYEAGAYHLVYQWIAEESMVPAPAVPTDSAVFVNPPPLPPFREWLIDFVKTDNPPYGFFWTPTIEVGPEIYVTEALGYVNLPGTPV